MRYSWFAVAGLLLAGAATHAQQQSTPGAATAQPAPPAPFDPAHNRLDFLLVRWEREIGNIKTLEAQCVRTTKDKTFGDTDVFEGYAKYMKPNLAMLKMDKKGKPGVFEEYICNGQQLYEYRPSDKLIRVHELPPPKSGQVADDNFLSFLFGMRAEEARRRYDLKLTKEDENWTYILIVPRFPADKADFQRAELLLSSKTFLPRRLWFEQPNGNEITWDLLQMDSNGAHVTANDFTKPPVPTGWKMEIAPRVSPDAPRKDLPPRVARPQQ
ncbi:MAG TPA: TIGR03009 domain-containing protein [Gemmataceae bacterium]|jgi:TIGR03009 family protein|nr:TIGR03009 domain-containing protein [Gemmataceae bacterium]